MQEFSHQHITIVRRDRSATRRFHMPPATGSGRRRSIERQPAVGPKVSIRLPIPCLSMARRWRGYPRFVHADGPQINRGGVGQGWIIPLTTSTNCGVRQPHPDRLKRAMFCPNGFGPSNRSPASSRRTSLSLIRHRVSHRLPTAALLTEGIASVDSPWKTLLGERRIVRRRSPDERAATRADPKHDPSRRPSCR